MSDAETHLKIYSKYKSIGFIILISRQIYIKNIRLVHIPSFFSAVSWSTSCSVLSSATFPSSLRARSVSFRSGVRSGSANKTYFVVQLIFTYIYNISRVLIYYVNNTNLGRSELFFLFWGEINVIFHCGEM